MSGKIAYIIYALLLIADLIVIKLLADILGLYAFYKEMRNGKLAKEVIITHAWRIVLLTFALLIITGTLFTEIIVFPNGI